MAGKEALATSMSNAPSPLVGPRGRWAPHDIRDEVIDFVDAQSGVSCTIIPDSVGRTVCRFGKDA